MPHSDKHCGNGHPAILTYTYPKAYQSGHDCFTCADCGDELEVEAGWWRCVEDGEGECAHDWCYSCGTTKNIGEEEI